MHWRDDNAWEGLAEGHAGPYVHDVDFRANSLSVSLLANAPEEMKAPRQDREREPAPNGPRARAKTDDLASRLAANVAQLREARGVTQQQIAKLAGVPRATWAHLESGIANPTLSVLHRAANALQVSLEELISTPRCAVKYYAKGELTTKSRGPVTIRKLLPDPIPGMEIDRMELPVGARMNGIPHTPGTTEYLMCEAGRLTLVAAGEQWTLSPGDVVVFRGDQRHSYANPGEKVAIGYSVVVLARVP
jgi:transcriptional regulator with XRE-family HTH domain